MRYLSLFSGIEAATAAWHPLRWECVAVSEIEPFPCAVLAHHYPQVPNLGDVTKVTEEDIKALGPIDIVVFGSPCQDLSVAGLRKGFTCESTNTITRSGLFFVAMRIVSWARQHCGCRFALWENVPGAFSSSKGRDFATVVEHMAGLEDLPVPATGWGTEGVAVGTEGLVEWAVLDAQWFGVAQRRRRVFALADFGDWSGRPPILLEPESLRGNSPPSREAGQVAPTSPARSLGGGGLGTDFDLDGGVIQTFDYQSSGEYGTANVAATLSARDYKSAKDLAVTHTLRGEAFDASEDGTCRGTPLVPVAVNVEIISFSCKDYGADVMSDISPTLRAMNHSDSHPNGGGRVAIAFNARQDPDSWYGRTGPLDTDGGTQAVAVALRGREGGAPAELGDEVQNCLRASGGGGDKAHVLNAMQVRRLTPVECERLQGFRDDYTNIPWRKQPTSPDGPRYKALGNSMAVPVVYWIGERVDAAMDIEALLG